MAAQIVTIEDLEDFRENLIGEIKSILEINFLQHRFQKNPPKRTGSNPIRYNECYAFLQEHCKPSD